MMNTILVPVDFSETSTNALFYAIQLFGGSTLEIRVLHVYDVNSNAALLMKNIDGVLEKSARNKMNELIQDVQNKHPDILFKPQIIKNHSVSAIVSFGDSGKFDFIVMGTKGASGMKEVFMGSVAGGVISRTLAPVIVVPEEFSFRALDEVVFALGNDSVPHTVLEPLERIVKKHRSRLKILHITKKEIPTLDFPLGAIADLNPSIEYAIGSGNTNYDLNAYLMKDDVDLLCMVRTKKGFITRLFKESVTLKQTFNSFVPLLILHA